MADSLLLIDDDPDVLRAFGDYFEKRPGNIREMRNVLERGLIMSRGAKRIGPEHLPDVGWRVSADSGRFQAASLEEVERKHIERTLKRHAGNRTRAAEELGISRATLINKIKTYALDL